MARAADTPPWEREPQPAERQPGQFARHPSTGAPYVAHPTETTKRTGTKADLIAECARAGINWQSDLDIDPGKTPTVAQLQELLGPRPKRVQYGRPSSLGKQIEDQTNLQKWSERMVSLGIARDVTLQAAASELVHLDQESAEFREAADAIARRAKSVAQAHLAAERGTHHHELTEDIDNDRDPVERMATGENLGVPIAVQQALVAAWSAMLATYDIEILATEATCVDDVWRQAGTLDRICRLRRALRFVTVAGEYVELPAGWVGILDIKTGRLRLDRSGFVAYWQAYSVQLASYAQSVPYDPDTDQRGEWPWPIDQRWAIIAHLDILAALDGEAVCRLVLVDIEAGRHAGALCVAAKAWEKRTDVFSLPIDDLAVRVPVVDAGGITIEPPLGDAPACTEEPSTADSAPAVDAPPAPSPTVPAGHPLDRADQLQAVRRRPAPDEGATVDTATMGALEARYSALGAPARAWIKSLTIEAMQAGVSFHAKGSPTARRYEIIRSLVLLAERDDIESDSLRSWLEPMLGDVAQFPAVTPGHLLGSLSATEAATFSRFIDGQLTLTIDDNGEYALRPAA